MAQEELAIWIFYTYGKPGVKVEAVFPDGIPEHVGDQFTGRVIRVRREVVEE